MQYGLCVQGEYLFIPVQKGKECERLEIFDSVGTKCYEFNIPCCKKPCPQYGYDYMAVVKVQELVGQEICLEGCFPQCFFEQIRTGDAKENGANRFTFHFSPSYGWLNDPNGLVYADGIYHLYFQYNPFDVRWENMSWGHAISKDLLKWEQKDTVMYPDRNGTMFSGCGLRNEHEMLGLPKEALLFYYTAAGGAAKWSEGKLFTQRLAYSVDGGMSLVKDEEVIINTICPENRDPKIFWHEETAAYVCVLWLEGNDYAVFRSDDLRDFQMTQRLTLQDAWECPDLFCLPTDTGEFYWVFWTADGFYFVGEFDGYTFTPVQERQEAYIGKGFYAAQTYAGIENRCVQIPWLRMENRGENYTGAMGVPRELSLCKKGGVWKLQQKLLTEFRERLVDAKGEGMEKQPVCMTWEWEDGLQQELCCEMSFGRISYDPVTGRFQIGDEVFDLPVTYHSMGLLLDDKILEVSFDDGIMIGGFAFGKSVEMQSHNGPDCGAKMQVFTMEER